MSKARNPQITSGEISTLLSPFGASLSTEKISKVREYISILLKWNELISMTSTDDPAEIVVRHFGESMFLDSLFPIETGRLADVGSGAGFPGLALKLLRPEVHTVLIESNKRKCAFLAEVVRRLDLRGVEILPVRFEEIRPEADFADVVTARALGGLPDLLLWTKRSLSGRGHIALWVGGEGITKISNTEGWAWQPAVRIPESQRRFILVGRPLPS
jgi:16S rRNA (guanine527-N7)-methyltransferase